MSMNNNRGVYITANTSINNGRNTRVRGFHVGSAGGSGTINLSGSDNAGQNPPDFRMWIAVSAFDNLTLPDGGVRFPNGVSVSVPANINLTLFVDP